MMIQSITRSYTIAFTMRSGSNEICNLLARNGLGSPGELFRAPLCYQQGSPAWKYFVDFINQHQRNGIFGSKMSHDHRAALDEYLSSVAADYHRLDDVLPSHRWVWLSRRDRVLQAISLCRAELTSQWTAEGSSRHLSYSPLPYEFFHILSRVMMLQSADLAWELYFDRHGITPLRVFYEDFFDAPRLQLERLIAHLGGQCSGRNNIDTDMLYRVQRTKDDLALRDRFCSEMCKLGSAMLNEQLGAPLQRWCRFFASHGWQ